MRFINNADEEIVIRKNKIISRSTGDILAEYSSNKQENKNRNNDNGRDYSKIVG